MFLKRKRRKKAKGRMFLKRERRKNVLKKVKGRMFLERKKEKKSDCGAVGETEAGSFSTSDWV